MIDLVFRILYLARWQIFDWSPLVAWLLVELVRYLLSTLRVIL